MTPARFLIGSLPDGSERWAAIDAAAHHLQPRIAERRGGAYLAPYPNEEAARRALIAAGAERIQFEQRARRGAR